MRRSEFIQKCGMGCLGILSSQVLLSSCTPTKYISANIESGSILVQKDEFEVIKKGETTFLNYVVVQNSKLKYPIALFRSSDNNYKALLMRCTHQGTELNIYGDRLQCPAHGSEFSHRGDVQNGPADENLRSFPVSTTDVDLTIDLS